VDGPDVAVDGGVGRGREGVAEVVPGDLAVPAVDAVGEPGEEPGERPGLGQRQCLEDADDEADGEVDGVVGDGRAGLGHGRRPPWTAGPGRIVTDRPPDRSGNRVRWRAVRTGL